VSRYEVSAPDTNAAGAEIGLRDCGRASQRTRGSIFGVLFGTRASSLLLCLLFLETGNSRCPNARDLEAAWLGNCTVGPCAREPALAT
jgi:hypothetical protein